jgi:hypothetical protein
MGLAGGEGKVGGKWRGARVLPSRGLGSSGGGPQRRLHGKGRTVAGLFQRGGAPATEGRGGRTGKVHWVQGDPFRGLVWGESGRRRGLRGEPSSAAMAMRLERYKRAQGAWGHFIGGEGERGRSWECSAPSGGGRLGLDDTEARQRRRMAREVVAAFQGVGDACLSPVQPEGMARGQTVGARGRFGSGCDAWVARWRRAGVQRRRRPSAGRREVGEAVSGSFEIFSKSKNQFCKFNFSPSSWLQMKKC